MLRRSPAPPEDDAAAPPPEGGVSGPPEFAWAWLALVSAPLVAALIVGTGLPAPSWALPGLLLVLAMAGTTPRRVLFGGVRLACRLPWWAWVLAAGLVGAVLLWTEGHTLLSCAAAVLGAGPIFTAALGAGLRPPRERTPLVNPSADEEWRARAEARWPGTAERAGLHRLGDASAAVALVEPPRLLGPGALHLRLDTEPADKAPEDVAAAIPTITRGLRAGHIVVRPVDPHDPDLVDVWLWRGRHPLDAPVTWRDLRPLPGGPGEWVPIGRTALGAVAALRWRISTGYFGAPETGKTFTQRALLYGCRLQRIPMAGGLHIVDTKGDFRPFRELLGDRYAASAREAVPLVERYAERVQHRYDALSDGETVVPDRGTPALLLLIGEHLHLRQVRAGFGKDDVARVDTALRYATGTGRAAAAAVHLASQLTEKEEIGAIRSMLGRRVLHWVPEDNMVDPALGKGALDHGARAHEFPASLKGAAYVIDTETRWPTMVRPAAIQPGEVAEVFGLTERRDAP